VIVAVLAFAILSFSIGLSIGITFREAPRIIRLTQLPMNMFIPAFATDALFATFPADALFPTNATNRLVPMDGLFATNPFDLFTMAIDGRASWKA
jgi:hypothetical protein